MAGLGRRTFAPGEVLTASNVMNYLQDQVVQTYAGTAARGSAIGTAVSEGMVSYLNDTDNLEVYRAIGTAAPDWNPVAFRSEVEAIPTVGLVPIIPTSVTATGGTGSFDSVTGTITCGTGMTAITANGVFTSTYKSYLIVLEVLKDGNASNSAVVFQMSTGGTPVTSGYATANIGIAVSNAAIQNLGIGGGFYVTRTYQANRRSSAILTINNPEAPLATTISGTGYGTTLGDEQGIFSSGTLNNTTSYPDLRISHSPNAFSGTINIYGYRS
jgi:hypothetical protein